MSPPFQIHFHLYGPGSSRCAHAFLQNIPSSFPCTSLGLPTTLLHLHPTHISASSCTYTSLHARRGPLSPPFANLRPPCPCPHWRLPHYHLMLVPTRHPLPCACHHTPPARPSASMPSPTTYPQVVALVHASAMLVRLPCWCVCPPGSRARCPDSLSGYLSMTSHSMRERD